MALHAIHITSRRIPGGVDSELVTSTCVLKVGDKARLILVCAEIEEPDACNEGFVPAGTSP
jgi:hypothetical protein